ncbi:hypothetical protein TIFTF001_041170 [Ficus carica]|uniref:GH18 domain-containing protein n=1 Tax=Ficus carica TaxID=3494 RepID=A0AA87Z262_FICCA|nr:hypothetical protein TIFTF001_041170 [Ficus carica]
MACKFSSPLTLIFLVFTATISLSNAGTITPLINLAGHCDPTNNGCAFLTSDIKACHSQGIKVLLSIGGGAGSYYLSSADDAR